MTKVVWDAVGEREFHTGVDHGVFYLPGKAVPWNGLTSVVETLGGDTKKYYQDGRRYRMEQTIGEFEGQLKAFTYPDEMDKVEGIYTKKGGLFVHDQTPTGFGLSFREKIGNDLEGPDAGYRLHLLYNLQAIPDDRTHTTVGSQVSPAEFSWKLISTPTEVGYGYRPTSHLSLKSTDLDEDTLTYLEGILYGTDLTVPRLPTLVEMVNLIEDPPTIFMDGEDQVTVSGDDVVDLGDYIYEISGANVLLVGLETYQFTINT